MSSGGNTQVIEARVAAKQEFAGRWEYVIDQAVFTSPPHESWSGAALVDSDGRLCGLGSLVIQGFEIDGARSDVNMFVPIDLLVPIIDEICANGRRSRRRGHGSACSCTTIRTISRGRRVPHRPADKAGLRPGDVIIGIDDEPWSASRTCSAGSGASAARASKCRSR
jgi:hypothetical protein